MASLYRNILKQSFKIAWRKKYLWFFGLFAIILTSNDAEFEILNRFFKSNDSGLFSPLEAISSAGVLSWQGLNNAFSLLKTDPISLLASILVLVIIVLLIIFIVWLMIISQSALVKNTSLVIAGKENNIQSGVETGLRNFWQVFGFNVLNKLAIAIAAAIISLPVTLGLFSGQAVISVSLFILIFLVLVPVSLSISLIIKYAIAFRVIKGFSFIESIRRSWVLFWNNWLVSLEMAITLFVINFFASIAIIIAVLMLVWPFFLLSYLAALISAGTLLFIQILSVAIIFVFVVACGSFLAVFQVSSWTGLFLELINRGATSKLARTFGKIL